MFTVVYETWDMGECPVPVRYNEKIPKHELNIEKSTVRGRPVKIISANPATRIKIENSPVHSPVVLKDYSQLRYLLRRHYRRSKWKGLVYQLIDGLIEDLRWGELLRSRNLQPHDFAWVWDKFIREYKNALCISPNTLNMIPRLERQPWLREYFEK